MAISFSKYVDITSAVGGTGGVSTRDLIGRLFSVNPLIPTNAILEFTTLTDVAEYFGTGSDEYKRAAFYFGWVSKNITAAKKISFARWADAAVAPRIYGVSGTYALGDFTSITDGSFVLTMGADTNTISGLDFSADASLADVASTIQVAVRAAEVGALWSSATVTYNATDSRFELLGGATGANVISKDVGGVGTNILSLIGWGAGAITSNGVGAQTVTDILTSSTALSNNFGSFCFVPDNMSEDDLVEASTWNTTNNLLFIFCVAKDIADIDTPDTTYAGNAGTAVTANDTDLSPFEYPEMVPMIILAATDYSRRNASQNYMYQVFDLTPLSFNGLLLSTVKSNLLDASRINYYAATQTAGRNISFYQRGYMQGGPQDPSDQNVYANEIWLKDYAGVQLMNLLLALTRVSANTEGRGQVLAVLQSVADQALVNGVISIGKPLTTVQKLYIGQLTGSDTAWYQVQNSGYWLDAVVESEVVNDLTEYKIVYTLVYSKDDTIRKVEGRHVLI